MGGVCIFIRNYINYIPLDISENRDEKITEQCAVQVNTKFYLIIVCTYRSTSGNFVKFVALLDCTLRHLYRTRTEYLICGDINVNYLMELYETPMSIIDYLYFV